jgi:hypothetical protein
MSLQEEIQKIYKEIKENPEEFQVVKTDELLSAYNKKTNQYLENKTSKDIENEKLQSFVVDNYHMSVAEKNGLMKKLIGYRYVDELNLLHIGKYTRWIQKYPFYDLNEDEEFKFVLASGAFLTSVEYMDSGIVLTLKTWRNKVFKISFDTCLIYQKLSEGEELVLLTSDYLLEKK